MNNRTTIMIALLAVVMMMGTASAGTSTGTVGNVTATVANNTSVAGAPGVWTNFTVNDTTNTTSWYNITFPSGFDVSGAVVTMRINGTANLPDWSNNTSALYINVSSGNVSANASTIQYINISNVTVPSTATAYVINVATNNSITVPLGYTVLPAQPAIVGIKFNSSVNQTATAGDSVNVSVNVSDGEGWGNIDKVVVNMSAFGAGAAEELTRMTNDTYWAVFNKSIQVTKFAGSTGAKVTANVTDKSGLSNETASTGYLNVTPAAGYQLKIFGPDSSAPGVNTMNQTVAIQDQYGNNLTNVTGTFPYVVTMSKTAGHATISVPNPQTVTENNTTAEGVFNTTFGISDESDEDTTIKVTSTGLLPDTKTLTYYGSTDHLGVSLNKTSMNANNGKDAILVTVQLKDADGVDIKSAGESVQLSQNTGAGLFVIPTSNTTDANGKKTFVITSTIKSGSDAIYAIATPSGATGTSSTITVNAIVNPANSVMAPADITVMAGTAVPVNVTTKDYDHKVISGVTVTFNVTIGKGKLDGTAAGTPVTAVSGTTGIAEVTFVCNKSDDASTINATIGGVVVIGNKPVITTVPNVINQFAVSPGKGIGLKNVNGTKQQIAIQLKDVHGNNNTTANVQILVTTDNTVLGNMTNGTTYYNNDLYLTTDGGIATFTYQVNASDAGTANLAINATAYGVTDTISIVTSGPEGIYLSFNESTSMVGDSVLATAQLTNEAGDPLAIGDKNITFTVRNPSGTLVGINETPTAGNGAATFVITSDMVNGVPGVYTVLAKNDLYGLEDTNTTTFAGPAVKLVLEANRTTLMVNQTVSLNATMKDANDLTTSSPGGEVTFSANGVQIAKVVLNNGVASTTYTRNTPATVTIEAFRNVSLQDSVDVVFTTEAALTVDTINVTPAGPLSMNVSDDPQTFTAVCKNGTTELTGITVTWDSSNDTVGIDPATGASTTFTALVNGTTTITATAQGKSDTVTVKVGAVCVKGELDGIPGITANDALIALRMSVGLETPDLCAADVVAPFGTVDATDALQILRASVGLVTL